MIWFCQTKHNKITPVPKCYFIIKQSRSEFDSVIISKERKEGAFTSPESAIHFFFFLVTSTFRSSFYSQVHTESHWGQIVTDTVKKVLVSNHCLALVSVSWCHFCLWFVINSYINPSCSLVPDSQLFLHFQIKFILLVDDEVFFLNTTIS